MSRLIEALKLTGRRRFALRAVASCRYAGERQRERGTSLVGRCLFGSLSALGLGYSLISGARWQDGDEGKAVGSVTWPTALLFEPNSSARTSNAKGTSIPHNRLLLASLASSTGDVAPAEVLSSLGIRVKADLAQLLRSMGPEHPSESVTPLVNL
jgi:hypothetical protein